MLSNRRKPVIFGAPSLTHLSEPTRARLDIRPPVRRGDLAALLAQGRPGTAILVDGLFASSLAVTPRECRELLEGGWTVIGSSSIGALRAAELWSVGMIGIGEVYTLYRLGVLRSDADVAVALDATTQAELTASMVHVRAVLSALEDREAITGSEARRYMQAARSMHWSQRDWRECLALWQARGMSGRAAADAGTLASDPRHHPKVRDAHLAVNVVLARRWVQR